MYGQKMAVEADAALNSVNSKRHQAAHPNHTDSAGRIRSQRQQNGAVRLN